ncbi:MAG: nitroreductase family deazaflavin-dependent oxidoreductase [Actinomycetota bacterium]|nr:nitroreductase family deazaflavin-dependent oxidoreductase [Actinomycetota bacterium]
MSAFSNAIKRLGRTRSFAWLGSRAAAPIDRLVHRMTGGRRIAAQLLLRNTPTLMLTTIGRKSGQPRTTPLVFVRDQDRFIVAGSNWGQRKDPDWALNLWANPMAWVQLGTNKRPVRARVADGDETKRLWPELDRVWPGYVQYRERSGRDIMVFVLEPAD